MARRSPARLLAPVALATCAVAAYAVVHSGTKTHSSPVTTPAKNSTVRSHAPAKPRRRTYVVRSGDVLSAIAVKVGVSVTQLESLNPKLDPQSLHPGEKIRLR